MVCPQYTEAALKKNIQNQIRCRHSHVPVRGDLTRVSAAILEVYGSLQKARCNLDFIFINVVIISVSYFNTVLTKKKADTATRKSDGTRNRNSHTIRQQTSKSRSPKPLYLQVKLKVSTPDLLVIIPQLHRKDCR